MVVDTLSRVKFLKNNWMRGIFSYFKALFRILKNKGAGTQAIYGKPPKFPYNFILININPEKD